MLRDRRSNPPDKITDPVDKTSGLNFQLPYMLDRDQTSYQNKNVSKESLTAFFFLFWYCEVLIANQSPKFKANEQDES